MALILAAGAMVLFAVVVGYLLGGRKARLPEEADPEVTREARRVREKSVEVRRRIVYEPHPPRDGADAASFGRAMNPGERRG